MKQIITVIILLALTTTVTAQTTEESGGVLPTSPLWGIDRALEQLELIIASGDEAKERVGLKHARERLLEIKEMKQQLIEAQEERRQERLEQAINRAGNAYTVQIRSVSNAVANEEQVEQEIQQHQEIITEINQGAPTNIQDEIQEVRARAEDLRIKATQIKLQIGEQLDAMEKEELQEQLETILEASENGNIPNEQERDALRQHAEQLLRDHFPEQFECLDKGGVRRQFSNACADNCGAEAQACILVITDACDCGPNACWDGAECVKQNMVTVNGEMVSESAGIQSLY